MFLKLQIKSSASLKNVFKDIKAVLTGTTNKALLSADCDGANTSITATTPAGWEEVAGGMITAGLTSLPVPATVYPALTPVSNGTLTLLPINGTNQLATSTNDGITWTIITLPVTLTGYIPTTGNAVNLAWGNGLWVLTNIGAAVNYLLTSPDGLNWTARTTTTAQQWSCPVWNGSIWVITALGSTQALLTSLDGLTWSYNATALPVATYWGTPVYANGIWVVTPGNTQTLAVATTTIATSTNATVWVSRTIPSMTTWTPKYVNGRWFITAYFSNASLFLHSADALTWTAVTVTTGVYQAPIYTNGMFVISTHIGSSGYLYVSYDGVTWILKGNQNYMSGVAWFDAVGLFIWPGLNGGTSRYSSDALTWSFGSSLLATASSNGKVIVIANTAFVFVTGQAGYYLSNDGKNWAYRSWPYGAGVVPGQYNQLLTVINNVAYLGFAVASVFDLAVLRYNANACVLRAPNADGVSYKKIYLDLSSGSLLLRVCEDINETTITNSASGSDNNMYAQPIDLINGSVMYISANNRQVLALAYLPISAAWGATTGAGFCAAIEYSRDDPWCVGTGSAAYPCVTFVAPPLYATLYVPRLKSAPTVDVTGSLAYLTPVLLAPYSKQVMDANSTLALPAIDIRISNFATLVNGVLGGTLLGGIKQTTTAFGSNGDEVKIGAVNYFICGSGTLRIIVPIA